MKYFRIGNINFAENELPDNANFPDFVELTKAKYDFAIANPNATLQEIQDMELVLHVPTLDELKAEKLNALNTHFGTIFAGGYYDTETGWTLFCGESNVIDYALLLLAITKKADEAEVKIGTYTGWQTSTKAVVMPLIDRYTEYMLPYTTTYRETKTNIEYAPDEATLDLIQW